MADRRAVLITRPEPDATETAQLIAERGFEPVIAPMMHLRPRQVLATARYDAIVTTSRNAIPALPDAIRHLPLLAVGSATAARARAMGFATVLNADGDAAALAELAQRELPPAARLLFAHGMGQGDALAAALAAAGFAVTRRRAYAVTAARRFPSEARMAIEAGRVHAALFLSAETARAFVRLLPGQLRPHLAGTAALAIGPAAAEVLTPLPWEGVRVSVRPTLDEVLALL